MKKGDFHRSVPSLNSKRYCNCLEVVTAFTCKVRKCNQEFQMLEYKNDFSRKHELNELMIMQSYVNYQV